MSNVSEEESIEISRAAIRYNVLPNDPIWILIESIQQANQIEKKLNRIEIEGKLDKQLEAMVDLRKRINHVGNKMSRVENKINDVENNILNKPSFNSYHMLFACFATFMLTSVIFISL